MKETEPVYALIKKGAVTQVSNNKMELERIAYETGQTLWRMVQI